MSRRRLAVVLMNLGGPDRPEAVKPFLFNLFNDPAIIGLPGFLRTPLARLISSRRDATARANYARMGGGSPLLPETEAQARALQARLAGTRPDLEARVFIAMRYWTPLTADTARAVAEYAPDEVVLLPLYPQYSTTTTASSLRAWAEVYRGPGQVRAVCCYPTFEGLVAAQADLIAAAMAEAGDRPVRVLFSAHGVPEGRIRAGDPYQEQVESTAAAVAARLGLGARGEAWDICYQSRVGPLKWLGPATLDAIRRAAADGRGAVVCPIAFVSEHIETLVELDHEYGELAREVGCAPYLRVPALGCAPRFIDALAAAVTQALGRADGGPAPCGQGCLADWAKCGQKVRRTLAA